MNYRVAEAVRSGLAAGKSRRQIAEEADVSPTTVTRYARLLGVPDAAPRRSATDWRAVQDHYDQGHGIDACRERFGFTLGAWDKAVARGDVVPRRRAARQLGRRTRDEVIRLMSEGLSQAEVARALQVTKSTVAFHVRQSGKGADPRFARRYDWQEVQQAIDGEGLSMTACLERFGFCRDTWSEAVRNGKITPRPWPLPLDELLVVGRGATNRSHLKRRLIAAGLKENRCEICGIEEWLGRPLTMELHHVNGDGRDNRLENLQLLCANCHSQTDNWGGRARRSPERGRRAKEPA